ncbi:MAG: family 43 glycosylhydrolase [Polyangia bacterium]
MKRLLFLSLVVAAPVVAAPVVAAPVVAAPVVAARAGTAPTRRVTAPLNPVLPGDFPDPSITRVGGTYYASATTSAWAPVFPILRSKDLQHWEAITAIFETAPSWSSGDFWAPELYVAPGEGTRTLVYYAAHKKDGPMCVAVADAPSPEGPYKDHGPIVCAQKGVVFGAIDAFAISDQGKRYLAWKADGNSVKQPTPILYQELTADGLALEGQAHEMFRNDAKWERELVEGPALFRHGDWLYVFYSGNDCCGRDCNYALGVARAKSIAGPWEKSPKNPILGPNARWKCPGHGTVISAADGRTLMLYHAFDPVAFVDVGRQGLIDQVTFGADGWPIIAGGTGPSGIPGSTAHPLRDDFSGKALSPLWQWPFANAPIRTLGKAALTIAPGPTPGGGRLAAVVGRSVPTGDYVATVKLDAGSATSAGLAVVGTPSAALGVSVESGKVVVWRRDKGMETVVASAPMASRSATLRVTASGGHSYRFAYSADGRSFHDVGASVDGIDVPPWDLGVRVALVASGGNERFSAFSLVPTR